MCVIITTCIWFDTFAICKSHRRVRTLLLRHVAASPSNQAAQLALPMQMRRHLLAVTLLIMDKMSNRQWMEKRTKLAVRKTTKFFARRRAD